MKTYSSRDMQRPVFISIALIVCLQFSQGHTEDAAVKADNEASKVSSLSRTKRSGYDMLRLARGLHMLRLGKRAGEYTPQEEKDLEELINLLSAPSQNDPLYFDNGFSEDGESSVHGRFRRAASSDGTSPSDVIHKATSTPKEPIPAESSEIPDWDDAYWYDYSDGVSEPQEGGEEDDKRSLGMLRLGKRQLSMLRLGKRSLGMLRLGKREDDEEKRSLGMLRLGKRQLGMLRLGKKSLGMLRLGKREDENVDDEYSEDELGLAKRPMSMLRLGKRPMSMLRLGKRPMSMLRLGKRPMSMLRLGKRPMSMLRLGKREDEDKRSLGMLRLGKRSTR